MAETNDTPGNQPSPEQEVLAFLQDPALYGPDVRAVERLETHGAYVFLGGDRVFKMKRPVRYDYMDFSTLERRRRACERELQVNRPNAPQIYEAVLPVTRETDGGLALDGNGEPVEWIVRMRRFPQRDLLSAVTLSGRLTQDLVKRLALAVARAHERAPGPQRDDGARHCAEVCHSLVHALEELSREHRRNFVALDEVASLRDGFETALEQIGGTLDSRGRAVVFLGSC